MRVSRDKTDPGFVTYASLVLDGYSVTVTLNGVEISGVVTADEQTGEVVAERYDENGLRVVENGLFVYERRHGEVKIKVDRPNDDRVIH